jgi:hypothetical protein
MNEEKRIVWKADDAPVEEKAQDVEKDKGAERPSCQHHPPGRQKQIREKLESVEGDGTDEPLRRQEIDDAQEKAGHEKKNVLNVPVDFEPHPPVGDIHDLGDGQNQKKDHDPKPDHGKLGEKTFELGRRRQLGVIVHNPLDLPAVFPPCV